jgi:hypothetical protein
MNCRLEQATEVIAGTSVAETNRLLRQSVENWKYRLRSSGNDLRDLVPAYLNNPDYSTRNASMPLAELINSTGLPSISTVATPLTCVP